MTGTMVLTGGTVATVDGADTEHRVGYVAIDGGRITDDGRIRASVPTISELSGAGAQVVVLAHLGRPKGAPDPAFSLAPVAARLGEPSARRGGRAKRHFRLEPDGVRAVRAARTRLDAMSRDLELDVELGGRRSRA